MNVGSLFSGIGGFDLGLERAGMRVVWQCESSEFCRRVLAHHWSGIPCYSDVSDLQGTDVEPVDLLCGGFPCQDISIAGRGAGIDGARSGLWSEFARLIGELRPRYVIVENVPALLGRGAGRVLGDLATLGYDAEWDCLPASAFGAPHRRDRFWLVAYPSRDAETGPAPSPRAFGERARPTGQSGSAGDDPHPDERRLEERGEPNGRSIRPGQQASLGNHADGLRTAVADAEGESVGTGLREDGSGGLGRRRPGDGGGARDPSTAGDLPDARSPRSQGSGLGRPASDRTGETRISWATEPGVGRVAHGVPDRVDRLSALGNALVPQIAEWIGRRILDYEEGRIAA